MATTPSKLNVLAEAQERERAAWRIYIECTIKTREASQAWLAEYDEEQRKRRASFAE